MKITASRNENLIGKKVIIKERDSWFYGEWGTVIDVDGDDIYVAIANDRSSVPVFDRRDVKLMKQ